MRDWIDRLVIEQSQDHLKFGSQWHCDRYVAKLKECGRDLVEYWLRDLGLCVGALPIGDFTIENHERGIFPGWKVRPEDYFYNMAREGRWFLRSERDNLISNLQPWKLGGEIVVFDRRCIPDEKHGLEVWDDDYYFLGSLLEEYRETMGIVREDSPASRFGISSSDWDDGLSEMVAKHMRLDRVRFERFIEFNVLSQLFLNLPRANDGQTSTKVWFEEFYKNSSGRADGGDYVADICGLERIVAHPVQDRWVRRSFRPIAVL